MLRVALLGAVVLFASTAGPSPPVAHAAERASDRGSAEGDEASAAPPAAAVSSGGDEAGPARKKQRLSKRARRRAAVSGRVVPEGALRKDPLPPPSGDLHVFSVNSRDEADVNLFNDDGSYDLESLTALNHVMRCRRTNDEKPIDPRLLTLLSHVYDHFGGKTIEIVSGYRNQRKQTSNHFKGEASDIRIQGVNIKKLRAFVETLDTGGMGIGLYPRGGFVHIDVRPLPSYRWIDYARPNPNNPDKRPPRGWKRKKLQS
jgi:uncharacterized protein YcbK (DUF882 family)